MKCEQLRDQLLDLASARSSASPEAEAHLSACENCARELASLRQTMNVLDEWQAPEPSPYFDQRLKARLREQSHKAAPAWLEWLRKPALAAVFAGLLVAAVFLFQGGAPPEQLVQAQPGSAVSDLQDLDRNQELYANFDWLDEMENQSAQPENR